VSTTPTTTPVAERGWSGLYRTAGVIAFVALAAMLLDIVLTMLPGWGPETTPLTAAGWLDQMVATPLLGLRNLDLLNVATSVVTLPLYFALFVAHRRTAPTSALLGLSAVALGTALFVAANAALPLWGLSRQWSGATSSADRAAISAAATALLATGAHGSLGALPAFLLSELGTLFTSVALVHGGVFGKVTGWLGVTGSAILLVYTVTFTFGTSENALITAVAIPGGLLMLAWYALVGKRLLTLGD